MKTIEKKVIKIESIRSRKESYKADKLNVCAYCRTSSDHDEQHNSYLAQVEYYTNLIQQNEDWEFAGIFADESSGTKIKHRVGFQEMMVECRKGNVDMILAKGITRFARNTIDSLASIRELKSLGVSVFFQKENLNTKSEQSEQLLSILSAVAQLESNNISENVKWGKQKRFQDGTSVLSRVPYGYKKGDGDEILIDKEKADVVRYIFEEALKGDGTSAIVKKLKSRGILSPTGGEVWNTTTVHNIIYNQFYKGEIIFQKTFTEDSMKSIRKRNQGELPMYLVENHHESYVTEKEWAVLQGYKNFKESKKKPKKEIVYDELSGNVICRCCGNVMRKESDYRSGEMVNSLCFAKSRGQFILLHKTAMPPRFLRGEEATACLGSEVVKTSYSCRVNSDGKCDMKRIDVTAIHESFVVMWNMLFQCQDWILVPLLNDLERASKLENQAERKELEERIKSLENEKFIMSQRAKTDSLRYDIFLQEMDRIELEIIELKNRKAVLTRERRYQNEIAETKKLMRFIESSEKVVAYDSDLFQRFVQKVYVDNGLDGSHKIIFLLKNGLEM